METTLLILSTLLLLGLIGLLVLFRDRWMPQGRKLEATPVPNDPFASAEGQKRGFSLASTLLIIGPEPNHAACRLQRKLLKPAIPLLIREDIAVMEVYGQNFPRKNGEPVAWLDPSLLRHALDADNGFHVIFVDQDGKTAFRNQAPMLTDMIAERAEINISAKNANQQSEKSDILRRLQAA